MSNKDEIEKVAKALRQHPAMSNKQLKLFYVAVLEIAAHERGLRLRAQELIKKVIVPEMLRRGI